MTTNKPGTVTQQPLFGCTSCNEDASYPADHLHVHNGECWCESCWCEIADWRDWIKLEPFRPALETDYERLQADHERLQAECDDLRTALAESRANDQQAMAYLTEVRAIVGGDDFPDMVRRCDQLRKDAERYRWLCEQNAKPTDECSGLASIAVVFDDDDGGVWVGACLDTAVDEAMQEPTK